MDYLKKGKYSHRWNPIDDAKLLNMVKQFPYDAAISKVAGFTKNDWYHMIGQRLSPDLIVGFEAVKKRLAAIKLESAAAHNRAHLPPVEADIFQQVPPPAAEVTLSPRDMVKKAHAELEKYLEATKG